MFTKFSLGQLFHMPSKAQQHLVLLNKNILLSEGASHHLLLTLHPLIWFGSS